MPRVQGAHGRHQAHGERTAARRGQRGVTRPQGPANDIGAYELIYPTGDHIAFTTPLVDICTYSEFDLTLKALTPAGTVDTSFQGTVTLKVSSGSPLGPWPSERR